MICRAEEEEEEEEDEDEEEEEERLRSEAAAPARAEDSRDVAGQPLGVSLSGACFHTGGASCLCVLGFLIPRGETSVEDAAAAST